MSFFHQQSSRFLCALTGIVLSVLLLFPLLTSAQTTSVDIQSSLDFGTFIKPTSGHAIVIVDKDGLLTAMGTTLLTSIGSGAVAQIRVNHANHQTLHISFSNDGNVPRLNLRRFRGTYDLSGPSAGGTFNIRQGHDFSIYVNTHGNLKITLRYGAKLRVGSSVATGTFAPSYTISTDFE